MDGQTAERSVVELLAAADANCRLCQVVIRRFGSLQQDLLSLAKANGERVIFKVFARPYGNSNVNSPEDWERIFLNISVGETKIEFRVWHQADNSAMEWPFDGYTGSESTFLRAGRWLRECLSKHGACNQANTPSNWLPHRLLEIGSGSLVPDIIRLKQTQTWQKPVRYAALSHCWGGVQPLKLLQGNIQMLESGIPLGDLPRSFQDAAHTARRLGILYIWIDSLCIIQDSLEDWNIESPLMNLVYGGSVLNIAAAASNDCTGGLFQNRPSSYLGPCLLSVADQDEVSSLRYQLSDEKIWDAQFESARLNTRAWIVQERMLSSRTLAFTKTQLFWECRCSRACEEFTSGYPDEYFDTPPMNFELPCLNHILNTQTLVGKNDERLGKGLKPQLNLPWHNFVMLYSRRDITFEKDKLIAISGIAQVFAQEIKGEYVAGLWKSNLLNDLLWETNSDKPPRRRAVTYTASSWSWASVECSVNYIFGRIRSSKVTLVDVGTQTMPGNSQWGNITGGYLQFQGKLFSNLIATTQRNSTISQLQRQDKNYHNQAAHYIPDEATSQEGLDNVEAHLLCLPLVSYVNATWAIGYACVRGLVLAQAKGKPRGYYKRWGVFEAPDSIFIAGLASSVSSGCYLDQGESMIVII